MLKSEGKAPQDHGGDIYAPGAVTYDFSASINPLGHPGGLQEALAAGWSGVLHYPDRRSAAFLAAVAEKFQLDEKTLIAGNGSAELIDLAVRASGAKRLIVSPPDFGLYTKFATEGVGIVEIPRIEENGFALDLDRLKNELRNGDLLIFSNPANPSGRAMTRAEILSLAATAAETGALILCDEAFCDFCPEHAVLDRAALEPALMVMRSMTKFYGIPGIRLGYMACHPGFLARMDKIRQPWSVSTLAQEAGVHCLADPNWGEKSRQYVRRAREKFTADLSAIAGVTPLPSEANYLLVRLDPPAPGAADLYEKLKSEGILIRHCGSFGLQDRYVRLAVRTVGENADLARQIRKLVK